MTENTYIGMDLGATKLLVGEVNSKGDILNYKRYPTGQLNQDVLLTIMRNAWDDYRTTAQFVGIPVSIGIGMIGTVDTKNGIWYSSNTSWEPINIVEELGKETGLPVTIENDVRAATLAEMLLGLGQGVSDFIYYNVGTGIAAGFVVNGKLLRGSANNNGEVGHMVVDMQSEITCRCGRRGCVEILASGYGLDCSARYYSSLYPGNLLEPYIKEDKPIPPGEIFSGAISGDALCMKLVDDGAHAIAESIMNLVRTIDPAMCILGGGLTKSRYYMDKVMSYMNQKTLRHMKQGFCYSRFNVELAGLVGAAVVGKNGLESIEK